MKMNRGRGRRDDSDAAPFDDVMSNDLWGHGRHGRSRRAAHKLQQLCRQVYRTVSETLAGDCGDPVLQSLMVESVLPAPDASRLLVRLYPLLPLPVPAADVMRRLEAVNGMIRREVARAIVRKRAPELAFVLLAEPGPEAPTT